MSEFDDRDVPLDPRRRRLEEALDQLEVAEDRGDLTALEVGLVRTLKFQLVCGNPRYVMQAERELFRYIRWKLDREAAQKRWEAEQAIKKEYVQMQRKRLRQRDRPPQRLQKAKIQRLDEIKAQVYGTGSEGR